MYGMVSTDHGRSRAPKSHSQSCSITGSQRNQSQTETQHRMRGRSGPTKSISGRVWGLMKHAWTGVKFALDSELDDTEHAPRYRVRSLQALSRLTRFDEREIKRIYRGFKAECPSGIVQEDTFRDIYAQFFPQGASTGQYAHYLFKALDQKRSGLICFEDFVLGLSVLLRGTLDEKLRWTFSLYDINGDGCISKEEMKDIVTAVFGLMGTSTEPMIEDTTIQDRVDKIFQKMDQDRDGVVSLDEFLDSCNRDENIIKSISVFDSVI